MVRKNILAESVGRIVFVSMIEGMEPARIVERDVVCTKRTSKFAESVHHIDFANTTCKNSIARNVHQILYVNMITLKDAAYTVRHTAVHITK